MASMSAGDRDTLAAELAAHQWHQPEGYESIWYQSAHANHDYYYRCAICTNDLDALADVLLASDWLRERDAEKWDEGWEDHRDFGGGNHTECCYFGERAPNPYTGRTND